MGTQYQRKIPPTSQALLQVDEGYGSFRVGQENPEPWLDHPGFRRALCCWLRLRHVQAIGLRAPVLGGKQTPECPTIRTVLRSGVGRQMWTEAFLPDPCSELHYPLLRELRMVLGELLSL